MNWIVVESQIIWVWPYILMDSSSSREDPFASSIVYWQLCDNQKWEGIIQIIIRKGIHNLRNMGWALGNLLKNLTQRGEFWGHDLDIIEYKYEVGLRIECHFIEGAQAYTPRGVCEPFDLVKQGDEKGNSFVHTSQCNNPKLKYHNRIICIKMLFDLPISQNLKLDIPTIIFVVMAYVNKHKSNGINRWLRGNSHSWNVW